MPCQAQRSQSRTTVASVSAKTYFFHLSLTVKSQQNRIDLVTRHDQQKPGDENTSPAINDKRHQSKPGGSSEALPSYHSIFSTNNLNSGNSGTPAAAGISNHYHQSPQQPRAPSQMSMQEYNNTKNGARRTPQ